MTRFAGRQSAAAGNVAAIQVAVSVLQFLQQVPWLAKDLVWMVVEADCGALHTTKVTHCCTLAYAERACLLQLCFAHECRNWQ